MKDERIISFFVDKAEFAKGGVDITEKIHAIVPPEQIKTIKYTVPSSTEDGIYYTIVIVEDKDSQGGIGFAS